ncbi:MAG: AAA family ATPase [Candidatus Thorarchaeota archaeon]
MNQFLLALCGLPASGKSSLADAIEEAVRSKGSTVEIVRTDEWRDDTYYSDFAPEKEGEVRQAALARVETLVGKGKSVIHDDTNYYNSMRHELLEIAIEAKCAFGIVHVTTPIEKALKWNRERPGTRIPEYVIQRISERFDRPGARYLWDCPLAEVDMSTADPDSVVDEIVNTLRTLEVIRQSKPTLASDGEFENLDRATRNTVSGFLQNHPELRGNREVSVIRQRVLKRAANDRIGLNTVKGILLQELQALL